MTWQPCDFYQCVNPECRSKVLVLQSPRTTSRPFAPPLCVCGQRLERLPYEPEEPVPKWAF
jgi:hypothetical protein